MNDILKLAERFERLAQKDGDGHTFSQEKLSITLRKEFDAKIKSSAEAILDKLVNKLHDKNVKKCPPKGKCKMEGWGKYHVVVKLSIKKGQVSHLGFTVGQKAMNNGERNTELVGKIQALVRPYKAKINTFLKTLPDYKSINTDINPNFTEIIGEVKSYILK